MINSPNNFNDLLFDVEVSPQAIALEPQQIDQALQLCSRIPNEAQQWQTYLNALSLFSFEQWLSERIPEIPVDLEHCSVLQPQYANVISAVCHLRVGKFKVCLLTTGVSIDEMVKLPKAAIDLPEYIAHLYVVLEVQEEQEQVTIQGFLRYDQLIHNLQSSNLQASQDWTYELPLTWFGREPDRLLLYLRYLEPAAIPLPTIESRSVSLSNMQAELAAKLPQLQSPECPLWQILTWEQATVLLTNPDLLNWLYRLQQEQPERENLVTLTSQLSEILQRLTQPVVNVGLWLRDELDEFAQSLAWVLLPPVFAPATTSLRLSTEEIETIIAELKSTGMEIPAHARGAYRDINLAESPLRLYTVIWSVESEENIPEWALLLILGAQPNSTLPDSIKLQVSDQTDVLVERTLEPNTGDNYLYTCVVGTWDEKFRVTIALMNGEALTLPPFTFAPK